MLTLADLAGLGFPDLIRRNVEMTARLGLDHRRCRRILAQRYLPQAEGEHTIRPRDFPALEMSVATMDAASQILAENTELLVLLQHLTEQACGRPAPVLRLVPREEPGPAPEPGVHPAALGLLARVRALLGGTPSARAA